MDRKTIENLMMNVYTSIEAAEYLNISVQRLNQLVHENKLKPIKKSKSILLFLKSDLDERKVSNVSNINDDVSEEFFDVNVPYVREAITGEDTRYDEEFDETPTETAKMFIFDNGEVYYVHEGYNYSSGLTNVPINGQEFDTSQITENIKSKLGKEYEIETKENESKGLFSSMRDNQKKNLIKKKKLFGLIG